MNTCLQVHSHKLVLSEELQDPNTEQYRKKTAVFRMQSSATGSSRRRKKNSYYPDRKKAHTVTDFIFWGSKITADGNHSHEIRRCLLPGRKAMTSLDSVLKSRDIILPTKVHTVKAIVFQVVI